MAKARSPEYPLISLKEAVEKVSAVYAKDYQNKIPRVVLAEHMGYKTLNGKSLGVLSAVGKYGLTEGRGDDSHVSDLAVTIIAHPAGSPERAAALKEAASKPDLFAELDNRFQGGRVSDSAIRAWMLQQKFIPLAADTALRSYRETKQFVEAESTGYSGFEAAPQPHVQPPAGAPMPAPAEQQRPTPRIPEPPMTAPVRVVMNGNRLDIQASVDLDGLEKLEQMLAKYKEILKMMQ
ncbi:MAG: hypothetical protein JSR61_06190 [Proteobacteria bacterium]|nr:hypothetical protein [Pseudomonadota bacterium]